MSKYTIRYSHTEYYEVEYEAESEDAAIDMYYNDANRFMGKPYDSDTGIFEVVSEEGVREYA